MDNKEALAVAKGTVLTLLQQHEKLPAGTLFTAQQTVDLGDLAFITATVNPGQGSLPAGQTETLPSEYWSATTNGASAPAVKAPTAPEPESEPEPEQAVVGPEPPPWDMDDGEVAEAFRACAPNTEAAKKFYAAYSSINPPFDDAQLLELLELAEVTQGAKWINSTIGRMFYAFNELNGLDQDPIVFEACPALRTALDEAAVQEKPKRSRKKKTEEEAVAATTNGGPAPEKVVSMVPTGAINAERELQGLARAQDTPSMGVARVLTAPPPPPAADWAVDVEARGLAGTILKEIGGRAPAVAESILNRAVQVVKAALRA